MDLNWSKNTNRLWIGHKKEIVNAKASAMLKGLKLYRIRQRFECEGQRNNVLESEENVKEYG